MSGTCSLLSPPGDPWPSCLLPSHYQAGCKFNITYYWGSLLHTAGARTEPQHWQKGPCGPPWWLLTSPVLELQRGLKCCSAALCCVEHGASCGDRGPGSGQPSSEALWFPLEPLFSGKLAEHPRPSCQPRFSSFKLRESPSCLLFLRTVSSVSPGFP